VAGLALLATLLSIWFRISTALSEIVVGTVAQLIIGAAIGRSAIGAKTSWVAFLAGTGAIVLTFLAGAELDPTAFASKWKEAVGVGLVGFFGPFLGAAAVARFVLHWGVMPSWLAGVALSTTSVAVVYAVMLETGFNQTDFGKGILAACFVNDLGTVIALGLIFAPFTIRTLTFVVVGAIVLYSYHSSHRGSFENIEDEFRSSKPNTYYCCCLDWVDWQHGPAARRSYRPASLEWFWPEPSEKITNSFVACER
jgi:Kef-type K+ transport system membrane component KefB